MTKLCYDVAVLGGGPAGIGAAIAARRLGAKVLLVEKYGMVGGMSTTGMLNVWCGDSKSSIFNYVVDKTTVVKPSGRRVFAPETLKPLYIEMLEKSGVSATPSPDVPHSIRIASSVSPERLVGFGEGYFFVQDRASAVSSMALSPASDGILIDVCSAPGGKSFAAAILSCGKAEIHSFDLHESKLSLIESGAERLGLDSISVDERDALIPDETLIARADRVICDVPCSGLGVLGKKPDLRYKDMSVLTELPPLQLDILTASSAYLKAGGELLYSTCTLNPAENEDVVSKFLEENPDFEPCDFTVGSLKSEGGMLYMLPHKHQTDGFFMAKIIKKQ